MKTLDKIDLKRFMGSWYVIANIPTFIEKNIYNAVESYRLDSDGTVATTFTFRKGGFEGPEKIYRPRGFIRDTERNAVWGMQFIRPVKAEYLISYVDTEYSLTIIGRSKRDYVWLMARKPHIPDEKYTELIEFIKNMGYDVSKIRKIPQKWNF